MRTKAIRAVIIASAVAVWSMFAFPLLAGSLNPPSGEEEFFIISSVDAKNQQIVLKRPTEVTELVVVNEKTVYEDEKGKAIEFKNLRAGDTVWVKFGQSAGGSRAVARIRQGPMTVDELHRRYVQFE